LGGEDWEGKGGSSIATEDKDSADVEAGEYAHDFLEVALSRLWEGRFRRRTTTRTKTKTMETSRNDGSALGMSREIHQRRPPPPPTEDETVVVRRRFNAGRGKDVSDSLVPFGSLKK
jgi:hypothetical protein